jgi:hypothetical protein
MNNLSLRKKIILPVFLCVSWALCFCIAAAEGQEGKIFPEKRKLEQKIIRLDSLTGAGIQSVTVNAGTTVIWINDLSGTLIEITFIGKQVSIACKSPVHFVVNEAGAFISNKIPFGAVASLCFIEKGEFDYMVQRIPSIIGPDTTTYPALKGKIIVQ